MEAIALRIFLLERMGSFCLNRNRMNTIPVDPEKYAHLVKCAAAIGFLEPDEMLLQELVAMVDAGRYGQNVIIEHGKLRWILEAVQQIKGQRDELRHRVRQLIKHRGHVAEEAVFEKLTLILPPEEP